MIARKHSDFISLRIGTSTSLPCFSNVKLTSSLFDHLLFAACQSIMLTDSPKAGFRSFQPALEGLPTVGSKEGCKGNGSPSSCRSVFTTSTNDDRRLTTWMEWIAGTRIPVGSKISDQFASYHMRSSCIFVILILALKSTSSSGFLQPFPTGRVVPRSTKPRPATRLFFWNDDRSQEEIEEEARIKVLESRRYTIRNVLKAAESLKNFRLARNLVPEVDPETGKPIKSDSKSAVTITAFIVAAGAILLRVGGRAALVSAVGLDFANDNPELKRQMDQILEASDAMDPAQKLLLFTAGWTAVKVLCFDAGGVVLALASGILFGGVFQGALVSAGAATFGSSVAFGLAKLPTPVREKALNLLDDTPSLRGIEKVVAKDGLKAILTLRLAPVLPIPIGLYNYVYGVTNVPYFDFAGGIFLGSLKPYLLDSYLGIFGKSIVEGDTSEGWQDILLLGVLGFSVLIGVFASQLANETWESVLEEVEAEKQRKKELGEDVDENDNVASDFMGMEVPQWVVDSQLALKEADGRIRNMIVEEYDARVWNYTKADGGPPKDRDPALLPTSLESVYAYQGFDVGAATADGFVLSPLIIQTFLKYADPLYKKEDDDWLPEGSDGATTLRNSDSDGSLGDTDDLLARLESLRSVAQARIDSIDNQTNR